MGRGTRQEAGERSNQPDDPDANVFLCRAHVRTCSRSACTLTSARKPSRAWRPGPHGDGGCDPNRVCHPRSEEHTSELQSHLNLVCRLLLEKKKVDSCNWNHEMLC